MNHKSTTLAVAAIIAAAAMTGVAFAVPQQVMAGGHGHGHGHNNHNSNGISVNQQVNQENQCSGSSPPPPMSESAPVNGSSAQAAGVDNGGSGLGTICANFGANSANIGHH